jgi:hypothetical protein
MVRNLLFLLCIATALSSAAQNANNASSKATEKQDDTQIDYKLPGAPMPPLKYAVCCEFDKFLTNDDIDKSVHNFIMVFNPTCSHCEEETIMLEKNIGLFKNTKIYLLATPVMQPYLADFSKRMHISEYPEIKVGIDSSGFLNNVFLYQALPQINIYRHGKLVKTFSGEADIDALRKYID